MKHPAHHAAEVLVVFLIEFHCSYHPLYQSYQIESFSLRFRHTHCKHVIQSIQWYIRLVLEQILSVVLNLLYMH